MTHRVFKGGSLPPFRAPGWNLGRLTLQPRDHPLVMGIINATPDSFHAGSRRVEPAGAVAAARAMAASGADLLDIGAESTRPGAGVVSREVELGRLLPVLEAVRAALPDIPVTVDTTRAATARAALAAGADAVNDISGGGADPDMLPLVAGAGCGMILMHMQGIPRTMQDAPRYRDVVAEVAAHLAGRVAAAEAAGIPRGRLLVDPGIGFGKTMDHNLALLARLGDLGGDVGLLLGASRKRFIGDVTGADTPDRLPGSLAALAAGYLAGAAVVRVHDVAESVQFLRVLAAVGRAGPAGTPGPR